MTATASSRQRDAAVRSTGRGRRRRTPTRRSPPISNGRRGTSESCLLVTRNDAERLAGVYNVSEIVRGAFQNAYLGYYAFVPARGPRGDAGRDAARVRARLRRSSGLHRLQANVQPDNVASRCAAGGDRLARGGLRAALPPHRRRVARPRHVRDHRRGDPPGGPRSLGRLLAARSSPPDTDCRAWGRASIASREYPGPGERTCAHVTRSCTKTIPRWLPCGSGSSRRTRWPRVRCGSC